MQFVSYEKLSKRARRIQDRKRRCSWNGINPATRRVESKKLYSRAKTKQEARIMER